jgi:hypothetical protein
MSTDLDLELVGKLHPQTSGSSESRYQARAALLAAIDAAGGAGSRTRRTRHRLGLGVLSLRLLAAGLAVLAAIVIAAELRGGAARPASAAAAVLERAARSAQASGGPRELRPGDYWYVHSRESTVGALFPGRHGSLRHPLVIVDAMTSYDRQAWIGSDRDGLVISRVAGPVHFLSEAAREQWVRDGRPAPLAARQRFPLPADAFDRPYKQLLALPTQVDALYRVVKHDAGKGSAAWQRHEMFTVIGDLLREDPLPARLRAALYRVAARIPGIEVLGMTHDGIGRPALAVALNDTLYGQRNELLFDPHTANLLGEISVVVKPGPKYHVKPGTVGFSSTYLTSGIVERVSEVPHR